MVNYIQSTTNTEMIILTGKTFQFREQIKTIGGKWDATTKAWTLPNTPENIKAIKKMKIVRNCGFCGEAGHLKTKCEDYIVYQCDQLYKKTRLAIYGKDSRYQWLVKHGAPEDICSCKLVPNSHGYDNFSVDEPKVCWNCSNFCCAIARPTEKICDGSPACEWTCQYHGTSCDQFLNDTRGT